jgi:hypothetical protein
MWPNGSSPADRADAGHVQTRPELGVVRGLVDVAPVGTEGQTALWRGEEHAVHTGDRQRLLTRGWICYPSQAVFALRRVGGKPMREAERVGGR